MVSEYCACGTSALVTLAGASRTILARARDRRTNGILASYAVVSLGPPTALAAVFGEPWPSGPACGFGALREGHIRDLLR